MSSPRVDGGLSNEILNISNFLSMTEAQLSDLDMAHHSPV